MSLFTRTHLHPNILRLPPSIRTTVYRLPSRQFHASTSLKSETTLLDIPHQIFLSLHDVGHTWALAIPLAALTVRLGLLTFQLPARRAQQRRHQIIPMLNGYRSVQNIVQERAIRTARADKVLSQKHYKEEFDDYRRRLGSEWGTGLKWTWLSYLQLPVFLGMAECMRSMLGMQRGLLAAIMSRFEGLPLEISSATEERLEGLESNIFRPEWIEPSMATEGLFWCQDLTVADPTLALPFMVSALMFANISLGSEVVAAERKSWQKGLHRGLMIVALLIGPLTMQLPAGILYYWACSSATSLASNVWMDKKYPLKKPVKACKRPLRAEFA
jgi:inner membrane protein COX18